MGFTLGRGHPFPAGTTVTAYEDIGQKPEGVPNGLVVIDTAVVAADLALTLTFDELTAEKRYYAVAQVGGVWRWVGFRTVSDAITTTDLAAHEADTTNIHGIADTAVVADVPHLKERVYYASTQAEYVAALAALRASSAGGVIQLSAGAFAMTASMQWALDRPIWVRGMGMHATVLTWATSLGAGSYAVSPVGSNNGSLNVMSDLSLIGPNTSVSPGVVNTDMHGVDAINRLFLVRVRIAGFKRGLTIKTDHIRIWGCQINPNYDNIYLGDSPSSRGDVHVFDTDLIPMARSSIACHGTNSMDGWITHNMHIGGGPAGFLRESHGSTTGWMNNCRFMKSQAEQIGNALILDLSAAGNQGEIVECTFDLGVVGPFDAPANAAGIADDYLVDCRTFQNCKLEGRSRSWSKAGNIAVFDVETINYLVWDDMLEALANMRADSKPIFSTGTGLVHFIGYAGGAQLRAAKATGPDVVYKQMLEVHASGALGWGAAPSGSGSNTTIPLGVALNNAVGDDAGVPEWVIYAIHGPATVRTSKADFNYASPLRVIPDSAVAGQVKAAAAETDANQVGFNASSTNTTPTPDEVDIYLRGL